MISRLNSRLTIAATVTLCLFISSYSFEHPNELNPEKILEAHIREKGGRDVLLQVKSLRIVLEDEDNKIRAEGLRMFPDKICDIITHPGGWSKSILNGEQSQLILPDTVLPITNPVVKRNLSSDAKIFPVLYLTKSNNHLRLIGETQINGRSTYQIELTNTDPSKKHFFYDKETWMLTRTIDENGISNTFLDYKQVSGIQIAHLIKIDSKNESLEFKLQEIEINPKLDETIFKIE
jgi:outer membrane lipoprotein-sorting protein